MAKGFDITSLFGDAAAVSKSDTDRTVTMIDIDKLQANEKNFYKVSKKDLDDLKSSIEISGILDPPSVCKADGDKYRIISGHRRCEAVRQLVKEGRKDLRMVPCFIRSPQSAEMEELELIWANATSRVLSSPELAQQAARVEELLYQLKEQGVDFPGRMRDHVAQACKISRTKLANLHAIETNLREPLLGMWRKGTLNDAQALELSRLDAGMQDRLAGLFPRMSKDDLPASAVVQRIGECAKAGAKWLPCGVCPAGDGLTCPSARGDAFLRHDLGNYYDMCQGSKCCWTCRNGRTAGGYNACDSMCSRAKAARTAANQQRKDKEEAAAKKAADKVKQAFIAGAKRYLAAADAAGLPDNARIDLTSYSGATVKELRSWAAGKGLEYRSFYRNDLEPRFVDVAKVSRQLQCSADYICGTIDQPWPIVPLSEQLESDQPPKWRTGKPPASGYYFCKFDCAGVTLRNDAIYNAASDTWCFPRGTTKIDAVCTAWVRLPEEDDA
jgi:ParB family chromosome partitioning protein